MAHDWVRAALGIPATTESKASVATGDGPI